MSEGEIGHNEAIIIEIIEELETAITMNGKPIPKEYMDAFDKEYYQKNPEEALYPAYSDEIISKFKEGVDALKRACVYVQWIDWLLSGDDRENSFLNILEKKLNELNKKTK